ncbi:hypothetical protein D3C78_1059920 [compost metagenome]
MTLTRDIALRQMITPRRLAQAALTQAAVLCQCVGQRQQIGGIAFFQFQFDFAQRFAQFPGTHFTLVKTNLNLALTVSDHPLLTHEIGAEQRL